MEINRLLPVGPVNIRCFHSKEYVDFLFSITSEILSDKAFIRHTKLFNVNKDCPVFDGLFGFCQASAGGFIVATIKLNLKDADIAFNWAGRLHHAKKFEALGFCYVNDIVLSILELLKVHRLSVMSGFLAKLMAAVVVIFLLMGDVRTTSSLLPYVKGDRKSLWLLQSREIAMKMVPREDGSTEGLNVGSR